jgi:hypothetical protein
LEIGHFWDAAFNCSAARQSTELLICRSPELGKIDELNSYVFYKVRNALPQSRRRCEIADQAIADLEASKTLVRAREAVELAVAKHKFEQDVSPEIAQDREAAMKAMKELERAWQRAIDKIAERASLTKVPNARR